MAQRRCLVVWWLLLTAVVIATSTAQTTDPSIVAWATSISGGALNVKWTVSAAWQSSNSLNDIKHFRVFVNGHEKGAVGGEEISYDVSGLTNNTAYTIQVKGALVSTSAADPLYSDAISATTLDCTAPRTPDAPKQLFVSGGFVQVSVQQPADTGGADLLSLTIIVRHPDSLTVVTQQAQTPVNSGTLTYNIYGLDAQTSYRISAFAVNEGDLKSLESDFLDITTKSLQLPGPCPSPKVLNTTGASVALKIIPPLDDGGGRIQGFIVYMTTDDAGGFEEVASTIDSDVIDVVEISRLSKSNDKPLLPETKYVFKAVVVNLADICISIASSLQLANATEARTTVASLPGPPPSPCFLKATGGMISMSLMKPANMQGAKCTGFSIIVKDNTGKMIENSIDASDDVTYDASYLQANTNYAISVAVFTNMGTTSYSGSTTMSSTNPTLPTQPLAVTAVNVTGGSAVMEWSLPLDNGGANISGYTLILISQDIQEERPAMSSPSLLKDLTANTLYTVKVKAINLAAKKGPSSIGATFKTTSPTEPSEPSSISSVFASGGAIEVAWNPPESRGGEPLSSIGYKIAVYTSSSCLDNEANSCLGCNAVKFSAQHYKLLENTSVCEKPTGAECPDGSMDCCIYHEDGVGFSCGLMGQAIPPRSVVGTTSTFFKGLGYSSSYYFGVQAINRAGKSTMSTLQQLQTTGQTAPSFPSNIRELTATGGSIQLTWDAPSDTGGGPVLGYRVYRDFELRTVGYVMPPFTDCGGMLADSTYVYGVAAVNGSLVEGAMASTTLTTGSLSSPFQPLLSLSAAMYNRLLFSTNPACDTGGETLRYQYEVKYYGTVVATDYFECCNFVVENLMKGRTYTVAVRVINSIAVSPWTESKFTTTSGNPSAPVPSLARVNTYSAVVSLGSSSTDKETHSYDVYLYLNEAESQRQTVSCQADVVVGLYVCPTSLKVETLKPQTEYGIKVKANGGIGSVSSSLVKFTTSSIATGVFGMSKRDFYADKGGSISTAVLRSGGTSGSVDVGVNVTEPETVLVRCERVASGGCHCTFYLTSSGTVSDPCALTFVDGQDSAEVSFSTWNDESAELIPFPVVVAPFGVTLSGEHAALLHNNEYQQSGFLSFSSSPFEVLENSLYATVDVVRLNGSTGTVRAGFESFDISAVAGTDYVFSSGTITMVEQQSETQIWVQLIDNHVFNADKAFGIRLVNPPTQLGAGVLVTQQVVILDDESVLNAVPHKMESATIVYTTGGEFGIQWTSPSNDIASSVLGYMVRVTPVNPGNVSSLFNTTQPQFTLSGLLARSAYRVEIAGWNSFGMGEFSGVIEVATKEISPPGPPLALGVSDVTNINFTLTWQPPRDDGGSVVKGYWVVIAGDTDGFTLSKFVETAKLFLVVKGLRASSSYTCSVSTATEAFSDNSDATSSAQITVLTAIGGVPGKPQAVALVDQPSGGTLTFFMMRPQYTGGLILTKATLYLRKDGTENAAFTSRCTIDLSDQKNSTCTVINLVATTSYEVYATFSNAKGEGAPGESKTFQTTSAVDLPSSPLNLRATNVTAGNIMLEWDIPADLGGASDVVGYIVYQKITVSGAAYFTLYDGQDSKERSFVARGLMRGSSYAFAVVALHDASFCADPRLYNLSSFLEVTTLSSSRVAPARDLFVLYRTGGSITLGWKAPDDLAGLPLLGYSVELESPTNGYQLLTGSLPSDQTNYTHYGLSESTTYSYVVAAVNEDGPSIRSAVFTATTTSVSMPGPVQNVNYVYASGGSITLIWDAPPDAGGRVIELYEISRPGRSFSSTTTVFEDHFSLSMNTGYTYTVSAFNGYFRGYSASAWASTGDPSLPDPPIMNASPFGGRLEVSWAKPENTGGIPISQYLIILTNADGSTTIESMTTLTLDYTFWDLLARTHYRLAGKSTNDFGDSVLVEYDVVTSPPDAPSAPPQPTASNIQGGRVDIQVESTKYTGGDAVTLVLYIDGEETHSFPADGGETTIYGLFAETEYVFKVSAKNTVAETKSAALKVTTTAISTPGQIQNLQQVYVTYSQMKLTWDNLPDTGGDTQLQYKVIYVKCSSDGTPTASEQFQKYDNNTVIVENLDYSSFYNVSVMAVTSTSLLGKISSSILVLTQKPLEGVIIAGSQQVTVPENAGFVSIPVERVTGSFGTISYSYMTTDESAIHGVNYEQSRAVINLDTNIQSDILNIPILNDDVYNPGIIFSVTIVDLNTGWKTYTRVILEDDGDAGFISFTQPSLAVLENSGVASLDVIRTGGSTPKAEILFFFVHNASSVDRFHFLGSATTFDVGVTQKTISVQIVNDIEFQLVPDSIAIGFQILDGGVLHGSFSTITLTALDDGDISLPKECVNLRQASVTGGALGLEWTQPVDRGGVDITLSFVVTVVANNQAARTQTSKVESTVVYGLTQRTSYQVFVQAVNSADVGVESASLLLSTTSATAPTAPLNIQLVSASSSSLQFKWLAPLDDGGSPIVSYSVYKVTTTTATTSRSTFSSILCSTTGCFVKQLQALTSYSIQIQASSAFVPQGEFSDVVTFSTTTPDFPDPPPIANVTWASAGAMTIQMFDPVNVGGSNIQEYWLYIRADLDPEFTRIYSGVLNEHTVYHLRYQTAYQIKYQVVNSVGPSLESPIKIYKTLLKSLPSAPLNVGVVDKTGGAITLSWDEPLDIGGRQMTGYAIKIVSINGKSAALIGYDGKSTSSRQGTVYGLTADTEYGMQVVAYLEVSNCFEPALQAWSSVLQAATTNATSPGSAPELLVGHYTGGIIQLVWVAPKDQGGVQLTGYTLNLVDDDGNSSVLFSTTNATVLSFVHNDLTATTKYSYTISTSNSAGSSPTSPILVTTTDSITFPSAPLNVQQLAYTTGGAISIGWNRSVDTGGQPIAGYVVYRNSVAVSSTLPTTARSFVNKDGLSASSSYTYTVRTVAQNLMVSMSSENCLAKTTEATKPQKAQSLSAVPGSSYLNVSWAPDGDSGGLPIQSYDVKLMLGSTVVESVNLKTDRSYLFSGLTASTTYSGYIKCNNDKGASEELSAEPTTANVSVPNAPEMPSVRSIFGGNFTIQVQPPRFTGGSPITSMKVYEYIGEAPSLKVTLKVTGAQASYTFYGVSASSKYYVACSAINSVGEGLLSTITTIATTPMNQPGSILTAPTFVGATGTSLSFSWSPPADTGGSQTLTYVVRVANSTVDATNPTTELSYTAKQLSYGSTYDFSVCAKNNIGDGTWSSITTATTQPDAAGEFNFAQTSVSVVENATQVALVVQRTSGLSGRITLTYSAEKMGTQPATIGTDYAVVSGSSTTTGAIVFESLQSEGSIVIFIINDPDYDPDETFAVRITSLTSASVGSPIIGSKNVATVTIVDDGDAGYISFEKPTYSFAEDARTGTVVIIREYGTSTSITLIFEFWGGTATPDVDYRKTTTPVVMDSGVTKATLTFSIINDKIFEYPDEYFFIRMSVTGGAILRQPLVRVTILDDGDVSNPGTSPPPELQTVTGGLATFLARLPDHNGSSAGLLSNYIVRLSTETTSIDFNMSATRTLSIGNLVASTNYSVIVAPSSPYGLGIFSSPTQFSTTSKSLPGAISSMSVQSKTGGRISLAWSPPADTGGIPISKYRVDVIGFPELTVENELPTTQAIMYGLAASTPYAFSVQAQNGVKDNDGWGTKSGSFKFSTTLATQPGSLVLSPDPYQNATGGKVYLSWKPPRDTGGLRISWYGIFARSFSRPWFLSATASPDLSPLFSAVETLNASTEYEFFVLANNSVSAEVLPGKLSIAEGSTQLSSSADLSRWLSVGTVITVEDSVFVVSNLSSVATGSIGLKSPHMSTSILSKTGAITGQATSFSKLATDVPSLPGLPPVPELSLATGGMINLVLRSPKDTGGIPILDFALYWNGVKLDGESYLKNTSRTNPLQLTAIASVSGLASVTSYNVSALALNSISLCKFGSVTTGPNGTFTTTTITAPGSPQLATYRITGGGITMTIVDPHDTGGNDIQLYRLYYKRNGTTDPWELTYKDRKHQAVVARLKNSTEYAFLASVSNGVFDSVNSSVKVVRTLNKSPPGSCEAPTLMNSTGGMLQVKWKFPADDGGSTVTGFYATVGSHVDGSGRTTVQTNTTSCSFYRLLADSSYDIVVRAENSNGVGPESAIVTFNTTSVTPPVGQVEVIVHRTTGGAAQISFDEPIDLGGVTSKDMIYSIYVDRDNTINMSYSSLEDNTRSVASSTRRLTDSIHRRLEGSRVFSNVTVGDMDPETLYGIQILPISNFASGRISSSFPVETVSATIPSAPVSLTCDDLTGGSISLSWGAPVDAGGMPLNPYTLSLSSTTITGPFTTVYTGLPRTTSIHNLTASSTYWVRVTAWNDIGESPPSAVLECSTRSITAPTAPENFRILSVGHDSIECAWDLPKDIGGDVIGRYTVTATTGTPAVSMTFPVAALFATLTALSISTSYSVSVIATNSIGDSGPSSLTRYARTSSGANIPSTPQIGCVSHDSVQLLWYPSPGATTYHIMRGGTEIGTTTAVTFTDSVSLVAATSYAIWVTSASLTSSEVSVTTLDPTDATDAICQGKMGHISQVNYAHNVKKQWKISPVASYSGITLTFSTFELECDHDYVEIIDASTNVRLWKGGCVRKGHFVYQVKSSVVVSFTSDDSVATKGFEMKYEVDGSMEDTVIPPPGNGVICSGHGRSQIGGSCKCSVGFTGEGCNNRVVCCSDPRQCHHSVCDMDPNKVIVVSGEFGDDVQGTGAMMNAGDKGTASKAVKTLLRAVALSQEGSVILVYPGVYSGLNNRNLEVVSANLTFSTLKGPFWTSVDCEKSSRFLLATVSSTTVEGFTLQNCVEADGGVFKILGRDFCGINLNVVNSTASQNGGVLYATSSKITLNQVAIVNSVAGAEAGAIYLEDSQAFMIESNVTKSTAIRGGAMSLRGTSSLSMTNSKLFGNVASESGGGVYLKGTISLKGVILDDNKAPSGGGLAMESGILVMENCVISNNKAERTGGGLTLSGGSALTAIATSIHSNKAQTTGGGVYATGSVSIIFDKQEMTPSTITGNTALNGAGIYIYASQASFQGLNVQKGHANESAGGVAVVDSTVEWLSITIQDNEAEEGGGLVLKNSQLKCKGSVLLTENKAGNGGAISMSASTMTGVEGTRCLSNTVTANGGALFVVGVSTVENVKQELNKAVRGACIYVENAKLSLVNSESLGCTANVAGGGLWVTDSEITVQGVSVVDSKAPEGGGIFAIASSVSGDMTIQNCAAAIRGGGMYLTGKTTVVGVNVDDCDAQEGGAVYVLSSELTMKVSKLSNSHASEKGGGLYATDSTLTLTETILASDTSELVGGGAYVKSSTVIHDGVTVERCSSTIGGGVYLNMSGIAAKVSSSSSQIAANNASDTGGNVFLSGLCSVKQVVISSGIADSGGGMAIDSNSATIEGCSIVNNSATFGGGISLQSRSVCTMKNSVVSQNVAEKDGGGIKILDAALWHDAVFVVANTAARGGGVFVKGGSSLLRQINTFSQVLFQRNTATTGNGGGIYIEEQSRVKASGLELVDGRADQGAGIFINSSIFELNDALFQNGVASKGGGVFVIHTSDLQLTNCSFLKNNASQMGGGIGSDGDQQGTVSLSMDNCTLRGNYAANGGGIMLSKTKLIGSDTFVTENSATYGGGVAVLTESSVTLTNWDFTNNTVLKNELNARGSSLSILLGVVTITDSTFVSNEKATLALNGGLIYVENSATKLNIVNSVLRFGQAYSGGLIYSSDAHVRLTNSTLHRGFAYDFGAGILAVNTILDISNSFFYDNFAFYDGGGIYMKEGGKLTVSNSFFDLNSVQDRGGAIFLSPGAAITGTVSGSNFTRNINIGYGSTIFVGRKNTVQLSECIISGNGGPATEGGALNAIDATVGIKSSLFELNTAIKGAAIQISRSSNATIENSTIRNNTAIVQGGALHASIRATAILMNSTVEGNKAVEGGAVYALGSAVITLSNTSCKYNTASSFGGAVAMKGSAAITIDASVFEKNKAFTGGGISIQNNASLSVTKSRFQDNNASDFGAGIYIDKDTEDNTPSVYCEALKFGGNAAVAGKDVYWVYYPWFLFDCIDCTTLAGGEKPFIATSATDISAGWWPANVTSGVSLGVELPTNSSSRSTTSVSPTYTAASMNWSLIRPKSSVLWPTVVVRDYYGAIATYDNVSRCRAAPMGTVEGRFSFWPPTWVTVDSGYIVFEGAKVFSKFSEEPYPLYINCTLSPVLQKSITTNVLVNKCNPGYENINGQCLPCSKGTYSLDGERCYLCPAGATCEQKDLRGTTIGVVAPLRQEGYFVSKARTTYAASSCNDPALWPDDDPCKAVKEDDLTSRIHECANSSLEVFYKHWSRSRIYACLSGNEYYACDTNTACVAASVPSTSPAVSISTAATQSSSQCAAGYSGIVCATCGDGYYKSSNGSCTQCTDPTDPAVERTTRMLALVPIVVAIAALLFLFYLFSSVGEQHIINHAQAASRFQYYTGESQVRLALQAAKAKVQRRVRNMMQNVARRAKFGEKKTEKYFFGIEPREVDEIPAWRPEKFKIMLGFFQVVGGFKEVYEIPWPHTMSRLMDICSLADFNFVSTTAAECLFKRDFFANYRISLFALCGMLVLVFLVTLWGILRYRVKLSTLPRHCVNCGLPVFTMEHRPPPALARRRAELVARLRKENKRRGSVIANSFEKSNFLAKLKRLWTTRKRTLGNAESSRVVRLVVYVLNWVNRVTQLPASKSSHNPRCPTSQRIKNDVLNMVVHSNLRLWRARVWMRLYYKAYQNRCIKLFFWILLLFYPMLCQRVIGMFYCDEVGDHYYMTLDRSNLCYQGTWLFYIPVGITLIIFWVIGVPLLFWVIIFMKRSRGVSDTLLLIGDPSQKALKERLILKMRLDVANHGELLDDEQLKIHETELLAHFLCDRNLNEPSTVAQVGFIYHSYDTHFWWFEVWDLGRKLLLNCIITLLAKAGANRIICGLVVLLVYLSVMLFCKPYKEPSDSALAGVVQIQLFITLFCGLILKMGLLYLDERVIILVTNAAIVTTVMTLVYAVFSIFFDEKRIALKKAQRQSREDQRRAVTAHIRKLWRMAYGYALTEVYLDNPEAGPMPLLVMTDLARRARQERRQQELNAQLELTSAMNPLLPADDDQTTMLSASQINVIEEEDGESAEVP